MSESKVEVEVDSKSRSGGLRRRNERGTKVDIRTAEEEYMQVGYKRWEHLVTNTENNRTDSEYKKSRVTRETIVLQFRNESGTSQETIGHKRKYGTKNRSLVISRRL